MLCKPHSFKIKVQWTAHNINNKNKQQHKHRQEVSPKETESVCAAALYHAIVKPEWLELNIYSYPETFSGVEMTRTNSFSLLDMEGKTEKMDTIKRILKKGGELPRFYVLPPAYRVASLWPSLHLHLTRTSQSRSPGSTSTNGKREE